VPPDDILPTAPEADLPQKPNHFSDSLDFLDALRKLPLCEARWVFRGQPDADWYLAPLIEGARWSKLNTWRR